MPEPTEVFPRLLTASELASQLGLSRFRLYELCREGMIPHVRLGRSVRFQPKAVSEWLGSGGTAGNGQRAA